jgi:hypothetical protein
LRNDSRETRSLQVVILIILTQQVLCIVQVAVECLVITAVGQKTFIWNLGVKDCQEISRLLV